MNFSTENKIAVRVTNLFKSYKNGTQATRGIDFSVKRGESVAILGADGAGKTTFLRQLTTELKPTSGAIEIFGADAIKNPNKAKLSMGVTPQEAGVFETLTVREHLELFGKLKGLTKIEARRQTGEIIENLELEKEAKKQVGMLSGGQRRRILIGLALVGKPPLLVLDEPTTGLETFDFGVDDVRFAGWQFRVNEVEGRMSEKRILILTLSFGAGHIRAAEAILSELQAEHPEIETRMVDALENCALRFRAFYVWIYFAMIRFAPRIWSRFFRARQKRGDRQTAPVSIWQTGCRKVFNEIEKFQPDLIFACEVASRIVRRDSRTRTN